MGPKHDLCASDTGVGVTASSRLRQILLLLNPCAVQFSIRHSSSCPPSAPSRVPPEPIPHPLPDLFKVSDKVSLFDRKVELRVQGLPSGVKVTLHGAVEQEWRGEPVQFVSYAHYVTDEHGQVDLSTDASFGGTYTGVEPMGLFWSMQPSPSGPHAIRMVQRSVERPLLYHLSVYLGYLSLHDLHVQPESSRRQPVAMTTLQRFVKGPEVRRLPVKAGSVRGTLFLPPGEGPFPGVVDMFGYAGGLMESRAALLASHGFAALALPFFNYQDLPPKMEHVNFTYFEDTVRWFTSHPSVKDGGIGVVAVSGGAAFALIMGWKFPEVVAIVPINSQPFHIFYDLYHGDRLFLRGVKLNTDLVPLTAEGARMRNAWMYKPQDFIPIWESTTRVLLLVSDDDEQVNPELGDMLYRRYPDHRRHLVEVVHYPGAGHLLEPPYTPHCRFCFNPPIGLHLMWGGRTKEHAKAQEDSWHRIITFLHKHLP